ncbi:MAG: HNH endonuclease [Pirellulales bacterium]|nr:HNH endonuclease [Pirellulales bacterium]
MPHEFDKLDFEIDHIVAIQHGGATSEENLALACFACNRHKGPNVAGIDSAGEIVRLFNPRVDRWNDHFRWNGAELVGLSAIGRVTVQVLAMNLDYRVALRRNLIQEGVLSIRE